MILDRMVENLLTNLLLMVFDNPLPLPIIHICTHPPIHNLIPMPLSPQYTAHTICPSLQPKRHHHDMRTGCFHSLIEQHLLHVLCLNHLIHILNKHHSIRLTSNLSFNHSTLEWLCHTLLSLGILIQYVRSNSMFLSPQLLIYMYQFRI